VNFKFKKLNDSWNAEPNVPNPRTEIQGEDVLLRFVVNPFIFHEFEREDVGILRFRRAERYRLGSPDDVGWYRGRCRFSKLLPRWGEFYEVQGEPALMELPTDWHVLGPHSDDSRHFLFYFRDDTFECVAEQCTIEPTRENSLHRLGKMIPGS